MKMMKEHLKKKLVDKAIREQENYIEELKKLPPEKILEKAYEKVMRDDLIIAFEYTLLSDEQLTALIETDYPLSACFDAWQKTDETYMDRLMQIVDNYSEKLVKEETEKQKNKKRQEPER
jgi:hypothetical protein